MFNRFAEKQKNDLEFLTKELLKVLQKINLILFDKEIELYSLDSIPRELIETLNLTIASALIERSTYVLNPKNLPKIIKIINLFDIYQWEEYADIAFCNFFFENELFQLFSRFYFLKIHL